MSKAIVYGKADTIMGSVFAGLHAAGHAVAWRNPAPFTVDQVEECDMVFVHGLRGRAGLVVDAYEAQGVPAYVVDLGYFARERGYHQIGRGGLNRIPDRECDDARARAIGLIARPPGYARPGYVLVCSQKPGDLQHGIDVDAWLMATQKRLEAAGEVVRVRPHPEVAMPKRTLEEDLAEAARLVTYNSTAAYAAFVAGVPVECAQEAAYAPWVENPQPFLNRVAYGQWTAAEITNGAPWRATNQLTSGCASSTSALPNTSSI